MSEIVNAITKLDETMQLILSEMKANHKAVMVALSSREENRNPLLSPISRPKTRGRVNMKTVLSLDSPRYRTIKSAARIARGSLPPGKNFSELQSNTAHRSLLDKAVKRVYYSDPSAFSRAAQWGPREFLKQSLQDMKNTENEVDGLQNEAMEDVVAESDVEAYSNHANHELLLEDDDEEEGADDGFIGSPSGYSDAEEFHEDVPVKSSRIIALEQLLGMITFFHEYVL